MKFVFQANNGTTGCKLWITDGTANGTALLKDIATGSNGSNSFGFTALGNGKAIFSAHDARPRLSLA